MVKEPTGVKRFGRMLAKFQGEKLPTEAYLQRSKDLYLEGLKSFVVISLICTIEKHIPIGVERFTLINRS